jgi:hypothetical protein
MCSQTGYRPPGSVQSVFQEYKTYLAGRIIRTPLPEEVHLLTENFPYWIKLEMPDPADSTRWIPAKSSVVIPALEKGNFDPTGFRFDESRAKALRRIPNLLERPNCIHKNLRYHAQRGQGGIRGDHVYVAYYGPKVRKVAFTMLDARLKKVVLVSSFWSFKKWVANCTGTPALHCHKASACSCK